jgi:hypothetical protein
MTNAKIKHISNYQQAFILENKTVRIKGEIFIFCGLHPILNKGFKKYWRNIPNTVGDLLTNFLVEILRKSI